MNHEPVTNRFTKSLKMKIQVFLVSILSLTSLLLSHHSTSDRVACLSLDMHFGKSFSAMINVVSSAKSLIITELMKNARSLINIR